MASSLSEVVRLASASAPPGIMRARVIAVDGQGGAGKTTFSRLLADALGGAPIVQTDGFASWDHPLDWWPRLLDQVLEPLSRNQPARYQRYDWQTRQLAGWHAVAVGGFVVLEGVSASRQAFLPHLSFRIWIATPPAVRLRRGLDRDGAEATEQWREGMATEDAYVARERPDLAADLVISGKAYGRSRSRVPG